MAKKKQESDEKQSKLSEALERLNKTYGAGSVLSLNTKSTNSHNVISTGSIGFDHITLGCGGFVKGKLYELMGWEGCLSADTYIKFINVRQDGVVQDCKGGTIKNLYERFHNRVPLTQETSFNVTSINEEDRVFRNRIIDVVKTGMKECFEIKTKKGFSISTTKDHKFYTENGYKPLSILKEGDTVFIHNNTHFSKKEKKRNKYKETTIKNYYKGTPRMINNSLYFRESVHRLVYEANMNGLTYEEYKEILNNNIPENLITIPEGYEIHHINEITNDNSIENLQMYDKENHSKFHSLSNHNNLRFIVQEDKIISIKSVGVQETYDIKCAFPYNNFIAQGIVVHNSGKSTICGHTVAECQKGGGKALYIDGEHAVDRTYFEALGVNTDELLISQPSCGEEGFNIALEMINTGEVDLVIIDSDSSLIPKKVLDGEIGDSAIGRKALLNSNAYPKLKTALANKKVCVIVISQYREKIGMMFGNPTTTQGGHALKFYSDCRVEVSKSLAKEGDQAYGNVTKVKATKNKMGAPYRVSTFEIIYGQGIDKFEEVLTLGNTYSLFKIWGKTITYKDVKYDLVEFKDSIIGNDEFYDEVKNNIINKIKNIEPLEAEILPVEELFQPIIEIEIPEVKKEEEDKNDY